VNNHASNVATLTVGTDNTSTSYSGLLRDGATAALSFVKTGSGSLTLSGANTYTGNTIINNGRLVLANTTGSGVGTGSVRVDAGATLQIGNANAAGNVSGSISNNSQVVFKRSDTYVLSTTITGIGSFTQAGPGTL